MMSQTDTYPPRAARWALVVLWMSVIFYMSSRADSHNQSDWLAQQLFGVMGWAPQPEPMGWWEHVLRKTAHFSEYAILALLLAWTLRWPVAQRLLVAWGIATLYAGSDEFHQSFVPTRGPSLWDVALDSTGAATAMLGAWLVTTLRRRA